MIVDKGTGRVLALPEVVFGTAVFFALFFLGWWNSEQDKELREQVIVFEREMREQMAAHENKSAHPVIGGRLRLLEDRMHEVDGKEVAPWPTVARVKKK